ncbi:MAG: DNA mismatch repair endonuclease MutL [Arsenophonus sp.]|nr:MAG: DNA mismatch repair endonuclease MutL [Arsenophonus sp.]
MSKIKKLSPEVINQIAAGEVIDRPASVVKELVENSIDANSTIINIFIQDGGKKNIRVSDNGNGISKDDLKLSIFPYYTSKICFLKDLENLKSFGFRGEALSSICSVSRFIIKSKTYNQKMGWALYSEGSYLDFNLKPIAHPIGTTVEILDLFYNIPVRKKFLRSSKSEFIYIDQLIKKIALSYYNITINFFNNDKLCRHYFCANDIDSKKIRISQIFGKYFLKKSYRIFQNKDNISIEGWISNENYTKIGEIQFFYVNNRIVENYFINYIIRKIIHLKRFSNSKIDYILYLYINPSEIDFNIHPSKKKIRFLKKKIVYDFIFQSIFLGFNLQSKKHFLISDIHQKNFKNELEKSNLFDEKDLKNKTILNFSKRKWNIKILMIYKKKFALIQYLYKIVLISLDKLNFFLKKYLLELDYKKSKFELVFIPVFVLSNKNLKTFHKVRYFISYLGFKVLLINNNNIKIISVIRSFRNLNLITLFIEILEYFYEFPFYDRKKFIFFILNKIINKKKFWTIIEVKKLLVNVELTNPDLIQHLPSNIFKIINFESIFKKFFL